MKTFLSGLNAFILTIALLAFGLALSVTSAFNSPEPAKQAVAKSGLYEMFVGEAIDDTRGTIQGIIEAEPEIRQVMIDAAVPYVKADMEQGLDSFFAWIKDPSKQVSFTVNAAEAREPVSKAVGNYVQKLIEDLPECTFVTPNFNVNNPFVWGCKLPNTNAASYNTAFTTLISEHSFWESTSFTLDDLVGMSEQELTQDYQVIADSYRALVVTMWVAGIIAVLSIVATWFLTHSTRRTLRRVGISFIIAGVILIINSIVISAVTGGFVTELAAGDELEVATGGILANVSGVLAGWLLWSGIIGTIVGILALVGSFFIKKDSPTVSATDTTATTPPPVAPQPPTTTPGQPTPMQ